MIPFVDKMHCIREEFLGFLPCKQGLTGEAIPTTIKDLFHEQNLAIDNCRGQGYDGAGNMAGKPSAVVTRIQEVNEKAFYVHCNSHILNLYIALCCKEQLSKMIKHVCVVLNFSPFKQNDLSYQSRLSKKCYLKQAISI